MNNITWVKSYDEYEKYAEKQMNKKLEGIPVKRAPFRMDTNLTEYDIDLNKPYIGFMVIDEIGDHNYYLLEFYKMKYGLYESKKDTKDIKHYIPIKTRWEILDL